MTVRRPHPATVVALFAVAGASQIVAGFDGRPTTLQLVMTVVHVLVAGGAAGWMALPERREHSREGPATKPSMVVLSRKGRFLGLFSVPKMIGRHWPSDHLYTAGRTMW